MSKRRKRVVAVARKKTAVKKVAKKAPAKKIATPKVTHEEFLKRLDHGLAVVTNLMAMAQALQAEAHGEATNANAVGADIQNFQEEVKISVQALRPSPNHFTLHVVAEEGKNLEAGYVTEILAQISGDLRRRGLPKSPELTRVERAPQSDAPQAH